MNKNFTRVGFVQDRFSDCHKWGPEGVKWGFHELQIGSTPFVMQASLYMKTPTADRLYLVNERGKKLLF